MPNLNILKKEAKKYKNAEDLLKQGGFSIDQLDKAAFGFSEDDIKEIDPKDLHIKWKTDMLNPPEQQKQSGLSKIEWAKTVDLSEPIDVSFENGKFYIEDGHHRYFAATILNKKLNVNLEIKDKPIAKLTGTKDYNYDDFHRSFFKDDKMLKFSSTNKAIQYLSDFSNSRVIIAAPVLSKLIPKLSKKHNIDESKILELASADPTYKGDSDKNQSKNINNIIEFYKEDKNINLEKTKELILKFNKLRGNGKIKQNTKLPMSLEELNLTLEVKDEFVQHSKTDIFSPLGNPLDSSGQYRLFKVDKEWDEVKDVLEAQKNWCVNEESSYDDYKPLYLFAKGNDFYALLSEEGGQFHDQVNQEIKRDELAPIKDLVLNNDLKEVALETDAKENIMFDLMSKEEILYEPDVLYFAIEMKDINLIKDLLNAGVEPDEHNLIEAIELKDREIIKLMLDISNEEPEKHTLKYAIETGDEEIVKLILNVGLKPDIFNLNEAIKTENKEMIKLILDKETKTELDKVSDRSLNSVIWMKDKEIVQWLLDAGIKPNNNSLTLAIRTKNKEIIQLILNAGIKTNNHSLEFAIKTKNKEIVKLILNEMEGKPDNDDFEEAIKTGDGDIKKLVESYMSQ